MVEGMSPETDSCQLRICQRDTDFWEHKIDFIAIALE